MAKHKLIDTWFYDVKDLEIKENVPIRFDDEDETEQKPPPTSRLITKKVEIEVRINKVTIDEGGPPYALKSVEFIVTCSEPEFSYSGTDIEALRAMAFSLLDEKFKIAWTNYYIVTVEHAMSYGGGTSTGLAFSYNDIEKGTTWDGKELLREYGHNGWKIRPWPGRFEDKGGRAIACIPATDTNKIALEEFAKRVNSIRDMIREAIKPEAIIKTLQTISDSNLLLTATTGEYDQK